MANKKEERIIISSINPLRDVMTFSLSEAIIKIERAIFEKDNVLSLIFTIEHVNPSRRKFYRELAKAIWNNLLEEKK